MLLKGSCKLVGARGGLEAAADARKTLDCLLSTHALAKRGYALRVAGTATVKAYALDDAVLYLNLNPARADATGGKTVLNHKFPPLNAGNVP